MRKYVPNKHTEKSVNFPAHVKRVRLVNEFSLQSMYIFIYKHCSTM